MTVTRLGTAIALDRAPGMSKVIKFGRNEGVPNGSFEPVTTLGSLWLPTTGNGKAVRIKAGGNAADDAAGNGAREVTIQGIDENWDAATEVIATAGTSASSATSTTFLRVHRAVVTGMGAYATAGGAANTGAITIEASDGSADIIEIPAGEGQSQHAAYTVPRNKKALVITLDVQVPSSQSTDLELILRENADVASAPYPAARVILFRDRVTGELNREYDLPNTITGPCDLWFEARGNAAGAEAIAEFDLIEVDL